MKKLLPLLLATVLISAPVFAQEDDSDVVQDNPNVITGGIGEEMDQMRSVQNQYDLKLLITQQNGVFLADVAVRIEDKKGNVVVDTVTDGPVLLAKLPKGEYKVNASYEGETKQSKVRVTPGKLSAHMITFRNEEPRESTDQKTTPLE